VPNRRYNHSCEHGRRFAERCPDCGEPGTYDGWEGSMIEQMGAYGRAHGVKPIGPHRKLTDEVFDGAFLTCGRCGGRGYLACDAEGWRPCDRCSACGVVPVLPQEEVAALRARIVAAFPDAGPTCSAPQRDG
jgi:hypothetical protein